MCGRLVNLDTVARVLADYYHLKTETQLAALDEALSKVPAVSVGGGHEKDHVADPGKMVEDLISRQEAIDELAEWNDVAITNRLNNLPSAQQWIPVTERLPERNGYYLVTGRQGAVNKRLYQDGYWYGNWTVFAWMPLPEPWKGEQDG